ncbi:diaminopimelate epimerase [Bacillus sp. FJAT-27231]|uniref:diaminopimelate epimerase n=1 Tax=Bacillus sp. FJAT-27231 TaxID=1679168 RepID=UPI000670DCF2|nr:diaminopimelate epimerase [Bacillus sp. FJAT-27231]KMY54329.1 diaminopimelate epimerase [Bacillus sp. FJAT-27231]
MQIELIKCHGSSNDFLLIDEWTNGYSFTEEERKNLSIALCNRESSLGADGILFVMESKQADAKMRIFNSDGSEASMCGNGLRCLGRYVCELLKKDEIVVETMKADLQVTKDEELYEDVPTYRVEISPVLFSLSSLPMHLGGKDTLLNEVVPELSDSIAFSAAAVPNPHLIAMVDQAQIASDEQKKIAERLNGPNDICPDGVNVSFVHPMEPGKIYVRTFERGVGFTNACGTAMSASSLVTCLLDLNKLEETIEVFNNGGKVRCVAHKKADGDYWIDLIGNATYLYDAVVEVNLHDPSSFTLVNKQERAEQEQYEKLGDEVKVLLQQTVFA